MAQTPILSHPYHLFRTTDGDTIYRKILKETKDKVYIVGVWKGKKPTYKRAGVQLGIEGQKVFRIVAKSELHAFRQFHEVFGNAFNEEIVISRPR